MCPASPYAATKASCELIAYTFTKLYNLPIACLRFFTVYGPGGRPDMAPLKFVDLISRGMQIDRYGDGSAVRDFTYVTDIVDGTLRSMFQPQGFQVWGAHEHGVPCLGGVWHEAMVFFCLPLAAPIGLSPLHVFGGGRASDSDNDNDTDCDLL